MFAESDHEKQCFHSDIFNLGLILLWMLVGEKNFQESDVGPMNHQPPVGCTSLSGHFEQVNFSEKAKRALDRHLESLRSDGYCWNITVTNSARAAPTSRHEPHELIV
jgi:hypothetical protein